MASSPPVLVTGASGFIGRHLVRRLAADGRRVRAVAGSAAGAERLRTSLDDDTSGGVEIRVADLTDRGQAQGLGDAGATCFHLAGSYRGGDAALTEAHVDGTANLLAGLPEDCRVVLLSSTSVYGWDQEWPADHASPPRPTSAYGRAKLAAEALVLARPPGKGVVARTTIVYGPDDEHGMLTRMRAIVEGRARLFPGDGSNRIHLTHVDDLVDGLLGLEPRGDGVFLFAGPRATPVAEIAAALAGAFHTGAPRFGLLPAGAMRRAGSGLDRVWSRLRPGREAPVTRHSVDVATVDRAYDAHRARNELGWVPRIDLADGVAGLARRHQPTDIGFEWRGYFTDEDEGLGTVYERFALDRVLADAVARSGARSVLHAPAFGMMGVPGIDTIALARAGIEVGLLDFDKERLEAVDGVWRGLGLSPRLHLVDGPDPTSWPAELSQRYDLVFSFAAIWWFQDLDAYLGAQARWADKGVLLCTLNRNVFLRVRAVTWHKALFARLNRRAVDRRAVEAAAARNGLRLVDTGLFDIPPFPDTSVPLARLLRSRRGKEPVETDSEGAWSWSIMPYLRGEQPDMPEKIARFEVLERRLPEALARPIAHHRYFLFEPDAAAPRA